MDNLKNNTSIAQPDLNLRIGIIVRELRKKRKLTQVELAKSVGFSQETISLIENGKRNSRINLNGLQNLAFELGVDRLSKLIYFAEDINDSVLEEILDL